MASNIPVLPAIERLSSRVIRILGGNPNKFTLQGTNTYLVGTGERRILIDTAQGFPAWSSSLASVLASEKCTVSTTLLTHWHLDHVLGIDDLLAQVPNTSIYKYPLPSPPSTGSWTLPDFSSYHTIKDGQEFHEEGVTLTALHSPGHTTDHIAFVLAEEGNAVFTGDNVLGHGTAVFEDLATYLKSLGAMKTACGDKGRLYPGHGDVVENGRGKITEYVEHRRKREEEILAALTALNDENPENRGKVGVTSMDVVKVVYKDVPEHLHEPAEGGLKQVLNKLKGEGKVIEEENTWRVANKAAL